MVRCHPIDLSLSPEAALAAWPADSPLAALLSGAGPGRNPWARWSILAAPASCLRILPSAPADPLARLRELIEGARPLQANATAAAPPIPFTGGWIGAISYDLGGILEPTAGHPPRRRDEGNAPLMEWHRCPGALVHDAVEDRWWIAGDPSALPPADMLQQHADRVVESHELRIGDLTSATGRDRFQQHVARAVELILRGDVFQVNLAHRLCGPFEGHPRALFRRLFFEARPWFGAYLEAPGRCILSLSPELFLALDPATRRIVTRPMKGTRAATEPDSSLRTSAKDAAELNMIVDLMRNDLGRVCEFGSVRVDEPRVIERHGGRGEGGVWQGVATVSGTVRAGLDLADVLRATFPPGSVTGAPKIRAMQIIDELEPVPRGPYCGAIGFISDCGRAAFNVAIRTAVLHSRAPGAGPDGPWTLDYSVGAGIVADSRPDLEWRETLAKAGALLGSGAGAGVGGLARLAEESP